MSAGCPSTPSCPDKRNARVHVPRQVARIADSIAAFGFNVPVLIDEKGGVLAGHGRVLAARRLGLKEVPTIALDHLSETQARAFMIADNRLGELASWDDARLGLELQELKSLDLDFSIEATGFEVKEIELRIGGAVGRAGDAVQSPSKDGRSGDAVDDRGRDQQSRAPVAQAGDAWALGPHRLVCGEELRRRDLFRDRRRDPAMAGREGRKRAPWFDRRMFR